MLELVTAVFLIDATLQHWPQERIDAALSLEGGPALDAAAALAGPDAVPRLVNGAPHEALLAAADRLDATLIVLGTPRHGRLSELVVGGVAGQVLRRARCSVLITRTPPAGRELPEGVLVGVDGSPCSLEALRAGEAIGRRFGVPVRVVCARGHARLPAAGLDPAAVELVEGTPVDVLAGAGEPGTLIVVGSRGVHGIRALGSVSERISYEARTSVLVVRTGAR